MLEDIAMSKVPIGFVLTAVVTVAAAAFAQKPIRKSPTKPSVRAEATAKPSVRADPEVVTPAPVGPGDPKSRANRRPAVFEIPTRQPAFQAAPVVLAYEGTDISPSSEAPEGQRPLQKEIAARLAKADFVPPMRRQHFRWLDDPTIQLVGWHGSIKTVTRAPDGWLVTVRMMPRLLDQSGGLLMTADHTFETYKYRNGTFNLVDFTDPGDGFQGLNH
jgi:hypothetical protein